MGHTQHVCRTMQHQGWGLMNPGQHARYGLELPTALSWGWFPCQQDSATFLLSLETQGFFWFWFFFPVFRLWSYIKSSWKLMHVHAHTHKIPSDIPTSVEKKDRSGELACFVSEDDEAPEESWLSSLRASFSHTLLSSLWYARGALQNEKSTEVFNVKEWK